GTSPLVHFRIVFLTGAAHDPAAKPGLANLTASLLSQGGTRELTYKQIVDAMFPMAAGIASQTDKEMTVFYGSTHVDNLEKYYAILRAMLLEPGWREDDFRRVKDDAVNYLRVGLRGNNDEELGKEVLYNMIYAVRPYGTHNVGAAGALEKMTVGDLQRYYQAHFTRDNLILGIAGGYKPAFLERMKKDFATLPMGAPAPREIPPPQKAGSARAIFVEKDTRSVAYSIGFPIDVKRGDPDYPALLVAQQYFGPHRVSGGRLFDRMREIRGLNYGDYAYIEYFPRGMFQFEPDPNLARQQQIFQVWIRPVPPPTAHFALRLALFELDNLIKEGLSRESFERTRSYVEKNINLLTKTKQAELGYAIDSLYYGITDYNSYVKKALAKLTVKDVNAAIQKHLRMNDLRIAVVAKDCGQLVKDITGNKLSPMKYNSGKPEEILAEDKIVERWHIPLTAENVKIVPVNQVFE
ncbi:MAG: pitrilysin family protein, partial [Bryobacteraceae bacterium]